MSKLTLKQDNFCKEYIKNGGNATQAYRTCYDCKNMKDKSINELSSVLLKNINITSRLKELQVPLQKKFEITLESILLELEEAREIAKNTGNCSAMVSASMGKAKIAGIEKNQLEITGDLKTSLTVEFIK